MDFKLNGDRNKWHLEGFTLKPLQQNQSKSLPIVVLGSDITSKKLVCHQLPQYMAWKPDPNSFATDAMQQDWNKMFSFAFPSFSLIGRVINKVLRENVEAMILVTPLWQTQPWYTLLLRMSIQRPLLLPALPNLLLNPRGEKHPFVKTWSLRLAAWKITGKTWKSKEFEAVQPNLSPCPGNQVQLQLTNKWVSWCCRQQIDPVCAPLSGILNYL